MPVGYPYKSLIEQVYLPLFYRDGEKAIPALVTGIISKKCFLAAYRDLPPIEQMPEQEKKEMKQYVIELFPGKSVEELMEAVKIIYAIGTISN